MRLHQVNKIIPTTLLLFIFSLSFCSALAVGIDSEIGVNLIPTAGTNFSAQNVNNSDFWDSLDSPSDISHADLSDLAWSVAGHTIDADIDMNDFTLSDISYMVLSGGGYLGDFDGALDIASHLTPFTDLSYNLGSALLRWDEVYVGDIHGDGTDSYFNQTLLISGDNPVSANSDANLVILSEVNYNSCINLTEGGTLGFQICYDGGGGGELVIRNMRDEVEYMTIDRDDGGIVFHNETTFVNITTTNISTTIITTSGISGRTAGALDTRGDTWILTGANLSIAEDVIADNFYGTFNGDWNGSSGFLHLTDNRISSQGLVGYWSMNDNTYDYSGNGNDGTFEGDESYEDGKFGKGASFDGAGDYVDMSVSESLNLSSQVTISLWIKPSESTDSVVRGIVKRGISSTSTLNQQYLISYRGSDKKIRFSIGNGTNSNLLTSSLLVDRDQWSHILCLVNISNFMECYVNGVRDSVSVEKTISGIITSNRQHIGKIKENTDVFNGSIDEVMIFNRSLSAEEILALYETQSEMHPQDGYLRKGGNDLDRYAKYQFENNNFNGSGNLTTTGTGTFGDVNLATGASKITFAAAGSGSWSAPVFARIAGNYLILSDYAGVQIGGYRGGSYGPILTVKGDGGAVGKVGINKIGPTEVLDVNGNVWITSDNQYLKFGATATDLQISSDGTYGNITALSGINIDAPFVNIDGDLNVTGLGTFGTTTGGRGLSSFSQGINNEISGGYAIGLGSNLESSGGYSFSGGSASTSSGTYAFSYGNNPLASGVNSVAFGEGTKAESFMSFAIGRYNVGGGTADSWRPTDPLFEIGNGFNNGIRLNAFTIYKNGKVDITDDLEIDGDLNQTNGNATINNIYGGIHYHNHTATPLTFVSNYNYTFFMTDADYLNGFTADNITWRGNSTLTAQYSGVYQVTHSSTGDGENNDVYRTSVWVNEAPVESCDSHKKLTAGGDIVTMNGNCFITLAVGDVISLRITNEDGAGVGNYYGANLNLVRVGN